MNRFNSICAVLAVLMLALGFVSYVTFVRDSRRQFVELDIDTGVNYAAEGAAQEMIANTVDLSMDYSDWQYLEINPEIALDTYTELIVRNLGYTPTDENKQAVLIDNTPCFIVVGYDGYYLAKPTKINTIAQDMIFTPKIPFLYKKDKAIYGLNLGLQDSKMYLNGSFTKIRMESLLTEERQLQIINSKISDDFMKTVFEQRGGTMQHTIYVPSEVTTSSSTNPIIEPSVIAYVDNLYLGPGIPMQSFAIGGTKITHEDFVGGYIRDGRKYYAYSRLIPDGVTITKVFHTPSSAASEGYYYDYLYMDK